MRRGYWTGFFTGGLIGMLALRAYGDEILAWAQTKLEKQCEGDAASMTEENIPAYRPGRRFRQRRTW